MKARPAICVYCKWYQPQSFCFHCACLCARSSTVGLYPPSCRVPPSLSCPTAVCTRLCTEVPLVFVCVTLAALVPHAAARQRLLSLQPQKQSLSFSCTFDSPYHPPPLFTHPPPITTRMLPAEWSQDATSFGPWIVGIQPSDAFPPFFHEISTVL